MQTPAHHRAHRAIVSEPAPLPLPPDSDTLRSYPAHLRIGRFAGARAQSRETPARRPERASCEARPRRPHLARSRRPGYRQCVFPVTAAGSVKTGRGENRCPSILPDPLAGGDISRLDQAERLHRQVLGDVAVVLTLGEQGVAAEDATSRGDVAGGDGEVRASANQLGVLEAGGADTLPTSPRVGPRRCARPWSRWRARTRQPPGSGCGGRRWRRRRSPAGRPSRRRSSSSRRYRSRRRGFLASSDQRRPPRRARGRPLPAPSPDTMSSRKSAARTGLLPISALRACRR